MTMRRFLSLLTVGAVATASFWMLAVPAWAASVTISGVEEIRSSAPRTFTTTASGGVGEFSSLSLSAGGAGLGTSTCSTIESSCRHSGTWNPPSTNGTYEVVATARRRLASDIVQRANVNVNIPPARPAKPAITLEGAVPTVTWKANPEADLKGYRLTRSANGASKSFVLGKVTRFSDTEAPTGAELTYQLFAVRNSPVSASGIESPASEPAKILVPAPQPGPDGAPAQATADPAQASADPASGQQGAAPGPSNPVALTPANPKPIDAPNLPPKVTVGPRRDVGFAPLLPYTAQLPKSAGSIEEGALEPVEAEGGQGRVAPIAQPTNFGRPAVQKSLYVAGALLLVVGALHITRAARRLGDDLAEDLAEAE